MSSFTPFTSIAAARRMLRTKELSPVELLEAIEARITSVDPKIGAYIERDLETAKKEAAAADLSKPLGGIPIGIKDAISDSRCSPPPGSSTVTRLPTTPPPSLACVPPERSPSAG